ncbi:MAG: ferredoxin [Deltaproteobacteria bacterium]|nr:ferredoxin [Deltaproteobacteria bacterium]
MALTITKLCTACDACLHVCPNDAVIEDRPYYFIEADKCTECLSEYAEPQCAAICPIECAIVNELDEPLNPPGSLTGIPLELLPEQRFHAGY